MAWVISPAPGSTITPEHWLNIATHGLEVGAAARVRGEYLAHLEDALDAGESVAEVMAEWGDPHRVSSALKKAHLTTREARYLPAGYAPSWVGLGKALGEDALILGIWTAAMVRDLLKQDASPAGLLLLGGGAALALLRWLCLSRGSYSLKVRAFIWWLLNPVTLISLAFLGFLGWRVFKDGPQVWAEIPEGWPFFLIMLLISSYFTSRLLTALSAARKAEAQSA